ADTEQSYTASAAGPGAALSWSASSMTGLDHYNVYRGTASGGENVLIAQVPSGTNTFTDANGPAVGATTPILSDGQPTLAQIIPTTGGMLAPGSYHYVVTAVDATGEETLVSNEQAATANALDATLNLHWQASGITGLTSYRIYRTAANAAPGSETLLVTLAKTQTSYSDNGTATLVATAPPRPALPPTGIAQPGTSTIRTETITFYNAGTAPNPSRGQIPVELSPGDNQEQIAQKLIAALNAAVADGGFNTLDYTLSDIGNGRIDVGGASSTTIVVDPAGSGSATGGALTGTPVLLWGDTQKDPLVGNSATGGSASYDFWFNVGPTVYVDKSSAQNGANAVEQVGYTAGAPASGGTFTLTYQGQTTGPIPYNATAAQVAAALDSLPNIGSPGALNLPAPAGGNVYVTTLGTGPDNYTWQVTFQNALATQNVGQITTDASVVTVVGGAAPANSTLTLGAPYNTIQAALEDPAVTGAPAGGQLANVRVEPNANASLGIARNQVGGSKIVAGDTFQVTVGAFTFIFEFTASGTDGLPVSPTDSNFAVLLGDGSALSIATHLVAALNAAVLPLANGNGETATIISLANPIPTNFDGGAMVALQADANYDYVRLYEGQSPLSVNYTTPNSPTNKATPFNPLLPGVTQPLAANNAPYLVGTDQFGNLLPDDSPASSILQLPKNTVLMIDAGSVFKLRAANIEVGSSTVNVDDSQSALQVLGIPGEQPVFTSYNDDTIAASGTANLHPGVTVAAGDWGGLAFNNDSDLETLGIFLNSVDEAKLDYGGGKVYVNGVPDSYDAVYLNTSRPAVTNNLIVNSASAAISANPNSFEVSRFGSDLAIHLVGTPNDGDTFTLAGTTFEFIKSLPLTQGDVGIAYNGLTPAQIATNIEVAINATLFANSVDRAEAVGQWVTVPLPNTTAFSVANAPTVAILPDTFADDYQRSGPDVQGNLLGTAGAIHLLASDNTWQETAANSNKINGLFVRIKTNAGASLDTLDVSAAFTATDIPYVLQENLVIHDNLGYVQAAGTVSQRIAGQLLIAPGVLVKLSGARIETDFGANLIAEGTAANPVIFTSLDDTHYGGGGTFDTSNNNGVTAAKPGDWGGLYFAPTSSGSLDHDLITYGGGTTAIEGGFGSFNAIEIHQAKVRVADSTLEFNAQGAGGDRNGRIASDASTIFVLGAQPAIVNNVIQNNAGAAISADAQSFNTQQIPDWGRATTPPGGYSTQTTDLNAVPAGIGGPDVLRYGQFDDNYGPLVRLNKIGGNGINGMVVRASELEAASIWDDTDIVHVLEGTITVPNFASVGGLRLVSSATQSLVVKVMPKSAIPSGFIASGTPLDIADRIGGEVQILGTPQHPVVITSFYDNSVGAGLTPTDQPNNNTDGAANPPAPAPGDWGTTDPNDPNSPGGGIIFDQYSNDRNVAMIDQTAAGPTPAGAQLLGQLAPNEQSGDANSRLGFQVNGSLASPAEVDTYAFQGTAGTQVWINVTGTSSALDSVVELVDANGNVLARSDESGAEQRDATKAGNPLLA
ncbi:MAG: hypothetical protein B7Z73_04055, partial [Planctomycetia bacterium 21-64-5]